MLDRGLLQSEIIRNVIAIAIIHVQYIIVNLPRRTFDIMFLAK